MARGTGIPFEKRKIVRDRAFNLKKEGNGKTSSPFEKGGPRGI
jgi:hypothetical protein